MVSRQNCSRLWLRRRVFGTGGASSIVSEPPVYPSPQDAPPPDAYEKSGRARRFWRGPGKGLVGDRPTTGREASGMRIEDRDIHAIWPYENNPRHNDAGVDAVAASLREFGFRQPIVVDPG